jgi:hypothetical protein
MPRSAKTLVDPKLAPIIDENATEWEVVPEAEAAVVAPRLGAMVSVRLEPHIARLVRRAAQREGISQSEFLRKAAEERAVAVLAQETASFPPAHGEPTSIVWRPSDAAHLSEDAATELIHRIVVEGVGIH